MRWWRSDKCTRANGIVAQSCSNSRCGVANWSNNDHSVPTRRTSIRAIGFGNALRNDWHACTQGSEGKVCHEMAADRKSAPKNHAVINHQPIYHWPAEMPGHEAPTQTELPSGGRATQYIIGPQGCLATKRRLKESCRPEVGPRNILLARRDAWHQRTPWHVGTKRGYVLHLCSAAERWPPCQTGETWPSGETWVDQPSVAGRLPTSAVGALCKFARATCC